MTADLRTTITPGVTTGNVADRIKVHHTLRPWRDLRAWGATPGTDVTTLLNSLLADGVDVKIPGAGGDDGAAISFGISGIVTVGGTGKRSGQSLIGDAPGRSNLTALSSSGQIRCAGDSAGYFWGALRRFTLDGGSLAEYGIKILDLASQGLMEDVEVKNCTGSPGVGITNDTGGSARSFSWTWRRVTVWENNIGVYLVKNYQDGRIVESNIYGNLVNQVKLGDGSQFTASFTIANSHVERANFSLGGDVTNILVSGLDVLNLIGVYMESHTTANSHDIEYVGLSAGSLGVAAQGEPLRLNISGMYAAGSGVANNWLVLPTDGTRVEVNVAGTVLATSYAAEIIKNEDQPAIVVNDPSGSLTRSTWLMAKGTYSDVLSSPLGGFGRYENSMEYSADFSNALWDKAAFTNACTVDANAATAPDGTVTADRINFGAVNSGFRQSDGSSSVAGDTRVASIYIRTEGTPGKCILSINVPTGSKTITKNIFVTNTWRRFWLPYKIPTGGSGIVYFRLQNGFSTSPSTVLVWCGQMETGVVPGPPIITTSARQAAAYGMVYGGTPVSLGAADSGGTGYKVLRVPN